MKTKCLLWIALLASMVACDRQIDFQLINNTPEEQESIKNDFTLIKACLGKSQEEATAMLKGHGYRAGEKNTFTKTENGVPKMVRFYLVNNDLVSNIELLDKGTDFSKSKELYIQWLGEFGNSAAYNNLVRTSFALNAQSDDAPKRSFATVGELISALNGIGSASGLTYSDAECGDVYANHYSFILYPELSCNYMQIYNSRTGQPSDDFTKSDLTESDLNKHILISKVDYVTFRYKGFYALNVSDKQEDGEDIPIISEYKSPSDFGGIKLFYNSTDNLLLDGTIVWSGCGELAYPETFRAGLPVKEGLPYPGQERFACMNEAGKYISSLEDNSWQLISETDLQHIWQTVSHQQEFQHYYGNSVKKIAVYLYAPSVGLFNPNVAYYLLFTEQ